MSDLINHPSHYTEGGIETIEILKAKLTPDQFYGFCVGNAIKYLTRAQHKSALLPDLEKARWYLDRLISGLCRVCWEQTPNCACHRLIP